MEKCQYHDELKGLAEATRGDVGEIKQNLAAMNTTLALLVDGKIRQSGSGNGNTKIAVLALEVAKYSLAIILGGGIATLL